MRELISTATKSLQTGAQDGSQSVVPRTAAAAAAQKQPPGKSHRILCEQRTIHRQERQVNHKLWRRIRSGPNPGTAAKA
jgi:hypothetical protein